MRYWSPPLWFCALEVCYLLLAPTALILAGVHDAVLGDLRHAAFTWAWGLLFLLMVPMLMGNDVQSIRDKLEFYRVPRRVVRLYCETRFLGLLSLAFWCALLLLFARGGP